MEDKQTKTVIVSGDLGDIYNLWSNFENFPRFMRHMTSVTKTGEKTSHWVMEGTLGKTLAWDAEITAMDRNSRIAWRSTGGDLDTSGQVTFADLGSGQVQVTFSQHYVPPAGAVGQAVASLIDDPDERLADLLSDFKTYAEDASRVAAARGYNARP